MLHLLCGCVSNCVCVSPRCCYWHIPRELASKWAQRDVKLERERGGCRGAIEELGDRGLTRGRGGFMPTVQSQREQLSSGRIRPDCANIANILFIPLHIINLKQMCL